MTLRHISAKRYAVIESVVRQAADIDQNRGLVD